MMRCVFAALIGGYFGSVTLLMSGLCSPANAAEASPREISPAGRPTDAFQPVSGGGPLEPPALLTNLVQLRHCAEHRPLVLHPFRIVADVLDADPGSGVLALRDVSGVEFLQLDLRGQNIEPGAKICLEGSGCGVKPRGFGLAIVPGMVVDNDGVHTMTVEAGEVFLPAGVNPIGVQWFNRRNDYGLSVEYQGPNLPRQAIPGSVLSRANKEPAAGGANYLAGLDYRAYEGVWARLPDFAKLQPVKAGVATNFDLAGRTRNENVGLEFKGYINIPEDGNYTFYTTSDDGSRLFIGESSLNVSVLSHGSVPPMAEALPATRVDRSSRPWVTLEGKVDFAGVREAGGELQIRIGNEDVQVEIFESGGVAPNIPLNTKVRVSGLYQEVVTEDGPRVPGMLLVSGWQAVHTAPPLEPDISKAGSDQETTNPLMGQTASVAATFPTITTAAEIKALPDEMARQRLPVSIRGVVTAILPNFLHGAVVQDSTKGVFVSLQGLKDPAPLQRGEYCQIEGVAGPGDFAPLVIARRITHLGAGQMPQPVRPTWDQLFNGSLDTQYAEIEGVVSAIHDQRIEMLTANGKITLELNDFQSEDLASYENDLVRIRGCAFAFFNTQTRELDAGSLRILGGAVDVLQPAPRDLFDAPQKNLGELLLFDPKAAPFHRLKVSAQVIHGRAGDYFLTDGTNGLRVTASYLDPLPHSPLSRQANWETNQAGSFAAGDLVEAAGFLDLGGAAAELKEAVMRKTGHAALPPPKKLAPEQMLLARQAGMLVQVEATLMNQWREGSESVLELQSGYLAFKARVGDHGRAISLPPSGSHLELSGVYVPQGSGLRGGAVNGFELLLDSPSDIRVLETPPWWTIQRVLVLVGLLAALLGAVLLWNKELQRKVQERGRQLELEVHHRRQAEWQQAAEAERSRIARDLHDELGTGLTEVSLLAGTGAGGSGETGNQDGRLRVIAEKARALVSGLDVIVWAIDPKRNSLQSFADYLGRYATELFSASHIVCRFQIPIECQAVALSEAARHSLFLAVKEALNNVIRHAAATEVKLQLTQAGSFDPLPPSPPSPQANWVGGEAGRGERVTNDCLEIVVADNGRGFDLNTVRRGNGLTNLQERLKALNGECRIESQAGKGTTIKFTIPMPRDSN